MNAKKINPRGANKQQLQSVAAFCLGGLETKPPLKERKKFKLSGAGSQLCPPELPLALDVPKSQRCCCSIRSRAHTAPRLKQTRGGSQHPEPAAKEVPLPHPLFRSAQEASQEQPWG